MKKKGPYVIYANQTEIEELARLRLENNEHKLAIQAATEILEQYERDLQKARMNAKGWRMAAGIFLVAALTFLLAIGYLVGIV